ncbi:MAG: SH3 domain-containing protein [Haliscomenobacter sp.]|nr:SH3 domain-containing protein [Haliscomenobacter sp.]MBK8653956.1 SH3 domain-containing protein [Haliscomenobacter sp.]MBP9075852.1 SH3 domain-containing protein [Haliscomenobacter sp.]
MNESKSPGLPRLEVLIIGGFFLIFTFWAVGKCSATRNTYRQKEEKEKLLAAEEDSIKTLLREKRRQDSLAKAPIALRTETGGTSQAYSRLYVVIDGLKMRRTPSLNAEVVDEFRLFEEVYFLDEVTEFTQEINLGKEVANEPWVKIQSKEGRAGWVYGAGVNFYKKKHPGAE